MPKITAVINTRNEESNIRYCLETVKWCDEIIVVDMESDDKTVEIAKEYTEKVFSFPKGQAYVETARKFAVEKASGDWILLIDADEMISLQLADVLKKLSKRHDLDVIKIPYRHFIMGAVIENSGWGYSPMLRFFRKDTMLFNDTIHAGLNPVNTAKILQLEYLHDNCIIHFSYYDSYHFVYKMNNYTNIEAQHLYGKKIKYSCVKLIESSLRQFLWRYVKLGGYKDGVRGFFLCIMMAFYQALSHIKLWELYELEHDPVKVRYERIRQEILGRWKEKN
jgi:glycosyltransferase involved in cell wall biosynthesis